MLKDRRLKVDDDVVADLCLCAYGCVLIDVLRYAYVSGKNVWYGHPYRTIYAQVNANL